MVDAITPALIVFTGESRQTVQPWLLGHLENTGAIYKTIDITPKDSIRSLQTESSEKLVQLLRHAANSKNVDPKNLTIVTIADDNCEEGFSRIEKISSFFRSLIASVGARGRRGHLQILLPQRTGKVDADVPATRIHSLFPEAHLFLIGKSTIRGEVLSTHESIAQAATCFTASFRGRMLPWKCFTILKESFDNGRAFSLNLDCDVIPNLSEYASSLLRMALWKLAFGKSPARSVLLGLPVEKEISKTLATFGVGPYEASVETTINPRTSRATFTEEVMPNILCMLVKSCESYDDFRIRVNKLRDSLLGTAVGHELRKALNSGDGNPRNAVFCDLLQDIDLEMEELRREMAMHFRQASSPVDMEISDQGEVSQAMETAAKGLLDSYAFPFFLFFRTIRPRVVMSSVLNHLGEHATEMIVDALRGSFTWWKDNALRPTSRTDQEMRFAFLPRILSKDLRDELWGRERMVAIMCIRPVIGGG
jgi:hypothetical protein